VTAPSLSKSELAAWLRQEDPTRLQTLWDQADRVRAENVGDAVYLRGLLELSNYCVRSCGYCGINKHNKSLTRYRLSFEEIIATATLGAQFGYGTVVMQSGEDYGLTAEFIEKIIRHIKTHLGLAVTLSLGERQEEEWRRWKAAGADRYLMRFETSNPELYKKIHPARRPDEKNRLEQLYILRDLGYEIGSGVMIGIPGQSYEDLADDILMFRQIDLDMIGVGPYIPHPQTALGAAAYLPALPPDQQAPATELMCYKVLALTRLLCPQTNIPSTTALATLNQADGRENGLCRGANIVMPNLTPVQYRSLYEIYPGKACVSETAQQCNLCLAGRIAAIGRTVGKGPGPSPHFNLRHPQPPAS